MDSDDGTATITTQAELADLIREEFEDLPGQRISVTQPIEQRINEMISGVQTRRGRQDCSATISTRSRTRPTNWRTC